MNELSVTGRECDSDAGVDVMMAFFWSFELKYDN